MVLYLLPDVAERNGLPSFSSASERMNCKATGIGDMSLKTLTSLFFASNYPYVGNLV
jgi:hypothetical protein